MIFQAHSANPAVPTAQPSTTGRLAPPVSSIRPPIWAAGAKPAKNTSR